MTRKRGHSGLTISASGSLIAVLLLVAHALPPQIRIGGIFEDDPQGRAIEAAFRFAVDRINSQGKILPETLLTYHIHFVPRHNSFVTSKKGIAALFGPQDPMLSAHVQSTCATLELPHIVARWELEPPVRQSTINLYPSYSVLNQAFADVVDHWKWRSMVILYEDQFAILYKPEAKSTHKSRLYSDVVSGTVVYGREHRNWTLQQPDEICRLSRTGLVKLQSLLKLQSDSKNEVYVQQVYDGDYRAALLSIKEMNIFNIVMDIADEQLHHVLRAMLQLQMNDFRYHYLFTTFIDRHHQRSQKPAGKPNGRVFGDGKYGSKCGRFLKAIRECANNDGTEDFSFTDDYWGEPAGDVANMDLLNLEDFRHNYVNMTGFRLIKREETAYKEVAKSLPDFKHNDPFAAGATYSPNASFILTTDAALIYDAVHVFAESLASLSESVDIGFVNLSCDDPKDIPWADGEIVQNYLNAASIGGLTGQIRFSKGQRDDFELDVIRLAMDKSKESIVQIGSWDPTNKTRISDFWLGSDDLNKNRTKNVTLIVTTILEEPYLMKKEDGENRTGNDRYKGFCAELMEKIAAKAGFNYTLVPVHDEQYGIPIGTDKATGKEKWSGMIGELLTKKADLAVAPLSITYDREKVIDFTKPFMNLGLSILFKVPKAQPSLFSFMKPLSYEIWMYVVCAYALVSLELFIIARFSPYEWYNPHPCNVHHDVVENQFTLSNTLWFCIGTLMQQGTDVYPRAFSTRIVGGIWWFFTLIIISSYTANLAAFLTVERMVSPIESADDLAKNKEGINYGVVMGGSTFQFFKEAKIPVYQKMFQWMMENEDKAFVKSYKEGIERVNATNYAFLMESTMIEYVAATNCSLTQIGGLLDSKGYGIGTPKDSIWRDKLSLIILELQEAGIITELKDRWWKGTEDCKKSDRKKENIANALDVDNFGGAFLVLGIGLAWGIIMSVAEFMWNSRKNAYVDKQSLCSEMAEELRFAVRCRGSRQKPTLRRQCSQCDPNHTTYVPHNLEFAGPEAHNGGVLGMLDFKRYPYMYTGSSVDQV